MRPELYVPGVSQSVDFDETSAQSAALSHGIKGVRLAATAACYVVFGSDPTATDDGILLPASTVMDFAAKGGDKIAVIEAVSEANGSLSIVELL